MRKRVTLLVEGDWRGKAEELLKLRTESGEGEVSLIRFASHRLFNEAGADPLRRASLFSPAFYRLTSFIPSTIVRLSWRPLPSSRRNERKNEKVKVEVVELHKSISYCSLGYTLSTLRFRPRSTRLDMTCLRRKRSIERGDEQRKGKAKSLNYFSFASISIKGGCISNLVMVMMMKKKQKQRKRPQRKIVD